MPDTRLKRNLLSTRATEAEGISGISLLGLIYYCVLFKLMYVSVPGIGRDWCCQNLEPRAWGLGLQH